MKYDLDKLEVRITEHIAVRSASKPRYKWFIAEEGKAPIKSGLVTGSRLKAQEAGRLALNELILKAKKS